MHAIGIDYWPASSHAPGVGRYVRELVRALVQLPQAPPLKLFDVGPGARALEGEPLGLLHASRPPRRLKKTLSRRWLALPAGVGLDATRMLGGCALFQRAFAAHPPVRRSAPQVLPLAELPLAGSAQEARLRHALAAISDVLTFSTRGRELVIERCGLDPERVHMLPVGCDHWLRALPAEPAPPAGLRVLALGRTDRRRHVHVLAAACALLRRRGLEVELVFAGRRGDEPPLAGPGVRWIEDPHESQLPALVAGSAVLAHLAEDELTPVTPLEGLACGAAVLASRVGVFEEALGGLAHYVEPGAGHSDPACLAERLALALEHAADPAGRAARRAAARAYSWERHARAILPLWTSILQRAPQRA